MVTQIMPHHTAYLHLTPNSLANRLSLRSDENYAHRGCQSLWFHHIISRTVTCSCGRSCDLFVRTNRVAEFVLGRAKGRGEKNHFLFAIFNLATPKEVVTFGILHYIKVKLFHGSFQTLLVNSASRIALAFLKECLYSKANLYLTISDEKIYLSLEWFLDFQAIKLFETCT